MQRGGLLLDGVLQDRISGEVVSVEGQPLR